MTDSPTIGPQEIAAILDAFACSGWTGMRLRVGDTCVEVGKDGPPLTPVAAGPALQEPPAALAASVPAPAATEASATPASATPTTAAPPAHKAPVPSAAEPELDESTLVAVTSPTVGSFWTAPDPGSDPFVAVGDIVAAGDQLGIVEVMKLMNPVVAAHGGEVVAIRASNADMVEFGQTLFLLRPDD